MTDHIESVYYVHVDSKNRDSNLFPYGNNYVLNFINPLKNVKRVELVSAKIPNSMYNLTNGSNIMSTNTFPNISISPGFYNSQSLSSELSLRISDSEIIQYQQSEGKFIYLTNDPTSTLTIHSTELSKLLGLKKDHTYTVYTTDGVYGYMYGIKSERVVDFSLNEYVFLDIEEFRTPYFEDLKSIPSSGLNARNMFAAIPLDVQSTQIKTFKESSDYFISMEVPRQTVSRLTIHWYDKDLNPLNFQGFENNAFMLRIHCEQIVNTPVKEPETPDRRLVDEYIKEIKQRIAEQEKKETKKTNVKLGKWVVFASIIGILFYWYVFKKI